MRRRFARILPFFGLYARRGSRHNVASFRPPKPFGRSEGCDKRRVVARGDRGVKDDTPQHSKERLIVKTSLVSAGLVAVLAAGTVATLANAQGGAPSPMARISP